MYEAIYNFCVPEEGIDKDVSIKFNTMRELAAYIYTHSEDPAYGAFTIIDPVGGQHSEGLGWHPSGEFCGECSSTNCSTCNYYKSK